MSARDIGLITRTVRVIDHEATGRLVRKVRKEEGVSLREMAKLLGISAPFLSDLELGRRQWTQERIDKITSLLTKYK